MIDSNRITCQIEEYISYKRSLGYLIQVEAGELRRFAKYTRERNYIGSLTAELAVQWATLDSNFSRLYMARRLETIRTFANYISVFDAQAQVPMNGIFGKAHLRTSPYVYTDNEVRLLMQSANAIYSPDGIRARTLSTAIGLMYATGIRVGELTSLLQANTHLEQSNLFITNSKFKKDRLVPLHPSVVTELKSYRDYIASKLGLRDADDYFFVSSFGQRFNSRSFQYAFQLIRQKIYSDMTKKPRLYDLRHSFACNAIKRWHLEGEDVNQKLYSLSMYMGHAKPQDTYWYLSATPELLSIAAHKYERRFGGGRQ